MRARLRSEGKWYGDKPPSHKVPALDLQAGEPAPKEPRLGPLFGRIADVTPDTSPGSAVAPSLASTVPESSPETPESLPPLEASPTAEGKLNYGLQCYWLLHFIMGKGE